MVNGPIESILGVNGTKQNDKNSATVSVNWQDELKRTPLFDFANQHPNINPSAGATVQ